MKLRTRLMVTFLIIVILPILLTSVAYSVVRIATKQNIRETYGVENVSMSLISNPVEGFSELTDAEYEAIYNNARSGNVVTQYNEAGKKYSVSFFSFLSPP